MPKSSLQPFVFGMTYPNVQIKVQTAFGPFKRAPISVRAFFAPLKSSLHFTNLIDK